ncbi:hypothetical protein [Dysgonomonas macrotermitis]|uniref:Uncharacterized protein n=1 Tax=Dysgonomonas macrotermitis TaxID=1346286 RepID=A0A1M5FIM7_9BACT|nr:hypothetical protein [Dysgonomonas macrotermitis]SHF91269.1 hypothetical protein SAMN05444362_1127 [Dysgonomonas macrotermitis]
MSKYTVLLVCILLNLIVGNSILFFGTDSPNYYLMVGMSVACISGYCVLYCAFPIEKMPVPVLLLLSVLTCIVIELLGCFIASSLTSLEQARIISLGDIFINNIVGLVLGILGNILMFPVTIVLGVANFGLLLFYVRGVKKSTVNLSCQDPFRN